MLSYDLRGGIIIGSQSSEGGVKDTAGRARGNRLNSITKRQRRNMITSQELVAV